METALWQARSCPPHAGLPAVYKRDCEGVGDSLLEVRIVEQDVGRLAAEFQRDALHRSRAIAHDRLANTNGARKRDLGHVRIAHKLRADHVAAAYYDVAKPLRKFGLVHAFEPRLRLQCA